LYSDVYVRNKVEEDRILTSTREMVEMVSDEDEGKDDRTHSVNPC